MAINTPFRQDRARLAAFDVKPPGDPSALLSDTVLRVIVNDSSADAVAVALVNRLVSVFSVQRVSLGVRQSGSTALRAVSDQVKLDSRRSVPRLLNAALAETLDSDTLIELNRHSGAERGAERGAECGAECSAECSAEYGDEHKTRFPAHAELYTTSLSECLLSFAVDAEHHRYAFLIEFNECTPFASHLAAVMPDTVKPSIALLDVLAQQERSFIQSAHQRTGRFVHSLRYGTLSARQSLAVVAGTLLVLSFVVPVTNRVTSRASIVAADSQLIVSPQNGFLQSSSFRAGDSVKAGEVLATLDNRDLRLTADKWQSEARKNQQFQAQALASRNRIELGRLRADMARIDAELSLVDRQLQRAELRAPFDGVITQGDLSQSLGAAVDQGEILFTVARSSDYRLELEVDEHDIALVNPGQTLGLRLSSAPDVGLSATIGELLPVAQSEAGASTFRVQAELTNPLPFLRPGMEGIAKIDVGSRRAIDVYTRKFRNGLRLWAWKLGLL